MNTSAPNSRTALRPAVVRGLGGVVIAVLVALAPVAAAQDTPAPTVPVPSTSEAPADSADTDAEQRLIPQSYGITGLVVDETRTTIGRDFYDTFYEAWTSPEGSVNYTVVVEEQPVPGRGTRVLVRLNDEVAFDTRLQPGYDRIREAALAAVGYTRRALSSAAPLSRGL
ncbi:MAG: CsgE family curli-type amyloid fiber assembly protein [Rhodothermales bacterium]